MNQLPLISVIVPVYNTAKYLPQCVDSILAQTYTNLQLILVNDGSTDDSGQICATYAQKDPRVQVIHQTNAGVSAARNAGLKVAKGEYIGFVDADDYITPHMYDYLYGLITSCKVKVSVCNFFRWNPPDVSEAQPVVAEKEILSAADALTRLNEQLFVCNKLFARELFDGIFFPTNVTFGEDMVALLSVLPRARYITYGTVAQYYYRQHAHSATRNRQWKRDNLSWLTSTDEVLMYAQEHQLTQLYAMVKDRQMDLAITFLRDCLLCEPFDKKSAEELRRYLRRNLMPLIKSSIPFGKKAFAVFCLFSSKVAKIIYCLLNQNKKS